MNPFEKTPKQREATKLLISSALNILLFGGSRSGKTFILVYAVVVRAIRCAGSRHVILRFRFAHIKASIIYDTFPKVMKLCFPLVRYKLNKQDWFVTLPNGSEIWFGGMDEKERVEKILGNEYATIYLNECSQLSYDAVGLVITRLAQKTTLVNKMYYDCNPPSKQHWTYQQFVQHINPTSKEPVKKELFASMLMNPRDNEQNLATGYIDNILATLPLRQRQRFELGQWLDDLEGALWNMAMMDAAYANEFFNQPFDSYKDQLVRTIVAVDPAVTSSDTSDETGIVVEAKHMDGRGLVLDDLSCRLSPNGWADVVVNAYYQYEADRVVVEVNNGGDLLESVIRTRDPNIPITKVRASKGKLTRAEPVAALYEQKRMCHVKHMPKLEEQMTTYLPDLLEKSPDRMDALVWGATELMLQQASEFMVW